MKLRLRAAVGKYNISPENTGYAASVRKTFADIIKNFQGIINWADESSADILIEALTPTFEKAKGYTPVATGQLKASGYLVKDTTLKTPTVRIGFGYQGKPDYAAFVHERVDIPHKEPTRAKFLSSALEEDQTEIQQRIVFGFAKAAGVK